jgi:Flp pilus assembly protein TadD
VTRAIALLASLAAMLSAAGCGTPAPTVPEQSLMEFQADATHVSRGEAESDLAGGRYLAARDKFARLVAGDPHDMAASLGLAESLLALGDYGNAVTAFKLVSDDPARRAAALQGQGVALMALGHAEAAGPLLLEAVKADPGSWRAWNALGQYYDDRQDWQLAAAAYQHALAVGGGTAIVLNNEGMSLMLQKRYAEAGARFQAALGASPRLASARNNLRLALAWQGRYEDAASNPGREEAAADVLNNVGYIAMLRGDYGPAQAYLLKATELSPSFNKVAWDNLHLLEAMSRQPIRPPAGGGAAAPSVESTAP